MPTLLQIQPTAAQRRAFAQWGVAQTPKVRTVSTNVFAVPADLFVDMPEELLIGALIDGHRYVSPEEDAQLGKQPPARLLDCGTCYEEQGEEVHPHPECPARSELASLDATVAVFGPGEDPGGPVTESPAREAVPGEPLPEIPAEAYGPDAVPLPEPEPEGSFRCDGCDREFTTARGRDMHVRQKHEG
ncbi:hypothetical protein [Streptomyces bacillaris]|uniref:hypothetical protein n=1 Tax=Streptomyces bacillaris TaxID=68179 RepID=UPI003626B28C